MLTSKDNYVQWFVANGGQKSTAEKNYATVRLFINSGFTENDIRKYSGKEIVRKYVKKYKKNLTLNTRVKYSDILTSYASYVDYVTVREEEKRGKFIHWGMVDRGLSRSTISYYYSFITNLQNSGYSDEKIFSSEPYAIIDEFIEGRQISAGYRNKLRSAVRVYHEYCKYLGGKDDSVC